MRISDWSSDVCSSDLGLARIGGEFTARAFRKADDRRVGMKRLQSLDDVGIGRDHPSFELRRAEAARPAVEQLHRLDPLLDLARRSEEHTSELQSLMRISYAVFCLKKKINLNNTAQLIYRTPV